MTRLKNKILMAWVRREGLLDKNCRPPEKTVVETKVYVRGKVAELNRKVGKLETCIAKNEEQQTTKKRKSMTMARLVDGKCLLSPLQRCFYGEKVNIPSRSLR